MDGILSWAVDGCLDWQRSGLRPPQCVLDATKDYLETEDALGQWISESCSQNRSASASVSELFNSWKKWSEMTGEFLGNAKILSKDLSKRGFRKFREPRGMRSEERRVGK